MTYDPFGVLKKLQLKSGGESSYYSLPALEAFGIGKISRLPVSIRIILESVLRNCDDKKITKDHVQQLAQWQPHAARENEIPFIVARIILQDFTGVPLLCDLAAMRSAAARFGKNPKIIEPLVPVDLVVDHSVQVDHYIRPDSVDLNLKMEFHRNSERYHFIKWGMQAFNTFHVVPPGIGIVHQVNLEHLARGVIQKDGITYPDTLVGTDSHTTMINALGVVGWGVGGIEAEAGMLGQPVFFLTPDVVGVHLSGKLQAGITATDLVLNITQLLRKRHVVGKFVEFFGEGTASLSIPDRATIANMSPEYGATMGFFPPDEETVRYLTNTGRTDSEIEAFRAYFESQGLFGMPKDGDIDYSEVVELDLASIQPSVAGPKRPQDRIHLADLGSQFSHLLHQPIEANGYGRSQALTQERHEIHRPETSIGDGDVLIAAITSCTNTSNPSVMLGAGILAKKAVALGLSINPKVKTSLAPGSRVVTEYLSKAGLLESLETLGFGVVAYGCTTCIGNSGPIAPPFDEAITEHHLVCASVLSGNRNFEARIHPSIRANFLMSPPLVVAFAIAGTVNIDLTKDAIGKSSQGQDVFLKDIWPSSKEISDAMSYANDAQTFQRLYKELEHGNPIWNAIESDTGDLCTWEESTYIAEPPFFKDLSLNPKGIKNIHNARALAIFGDSVTTDHISPAGSISASSPAGKYLLANGVDKDEFNSYGSRRGNHEVMIRGTFANVRIRNLMLDANIDGSRIEGGVTRHQPDGELMSIYDASRKYMAKNIPSLIFAGEEYGTGSSRDWAAKGTQLLGVRAVIAKSFERIHRFNLVGMGILPLQLPKDMSVERLNILGNEEFDIIGLEGALEPKQQVVMTIHAPQGHKQEVKLRLCVETPIEIEYLHQGGILPYVLIDLLRKT